MTSRTDRPRDVVIVGGGTAGAVLAARLSEDPARRVLLIEAGPEARSPLYRIPLGIGRLRAARGGLWRDTSAPEPGLDGRQLDLVTGRVVGGSAAINGMVYLRPPPADFDRWVARGATGWDANALAPIFARMEDTAQGTLAPRLARADHDLDQAFLRACDAAGLRRADGLAAAQDPCAGRLRFTIRDGRRHSTPQAYLTPARARPNLQIVTGATALSIVVEEGRARAVRFRHRGVECRAAAEDAICVAAGALRSPLLLMRSGIGPAVALRRHGIAVVADLPGVGGNLQTHVDVALRIACPAPITLHSLLRAERILPAMAQALLFGSGPAARFPGEVAAFLRSDPNDALPDLLCHLVEGLGIRGIRWPLLRTSAGPLDRDGFSCRIMLLRPESRGRVDLRSADPRDPPVLRFAHLSHPGEMARLIAGVRRMRALFADPAFAALRGAEIEPGEALRDDAALAAWIRARADMQCHPVGTCAIGTDAQAVVDPALRVIGIDGLRVVDASVMPTIVGANTFATTVAIAERAARLIADVRSAPG